MPGILNHPTPLALWLLASAEFVAPDIVELPRANGPPTRVAAAPRPDQSGPTAGVSTPTDAPAAMPRISSRFGLRADPFGRLARMHYGIDIPGPTGTPVRAAQTGIVRYAGRAGSYGNLVEIAHGGGVSTRYAHLARILVPSGAQVTRGQTIAWIGSTGRSTGSHLHFEVRANGRAHDPLPHLLGASAPSRRSAVISVEPHRSDFARARDGRPEDSGPEL